MGFGRPETGGVALPRIIVLDEATANKIAAGEVVERPASAVKELLENSLDAGADRIDIEIAEGGLKSIMVADNGCGMEPEDAKTAFLRHATSKIQYAEDLENIKTLGFRGEALPSIAAVSKLTMKTRPPESFSGTALEIQGGRLISVSPAGCPAGTTVQLEDLFYNTPARRKHMKSVSTEAGLISDIVARMAVSRPEVKIRLVSNGRLVFQSDGSGKLVNVLASVYGPGVAGEMLPVDYDDGAIRLLGFAGRPKVHRSSRRHIDIFVNGRYVKNIALTSAVVDAYHTIIPQGRFPLAVVCINMDASAVDVNIHPSKMEIKIAEDRKLFDIVRHAVRKALFTPDIVPATSASLSFQKNIMQTTYQPGKIQWKENEIKLRQPGGETRGAVSETAVAYPGNNPETAENKNGYLSEVVAAVSEPLRDLATHGNSEKLKIQFENSRDLLDSLYVIGFLPPTYILCGGVEGLYVLDQHAAHERVFYEKFYNRFNSHESAVQYLLMPSALHLTHREAETVKDNMELIKKIGIIMEDFGGQSMVLRGVPTGLPEGKEEEFVRDVLDRLASPGNFPGRGEIHFAAAAAAACGAAVKSGTKTSPAEAGALLKDLAKTENPYTCPHGRPTIICINTGELSARFKRT